MDNTPGTPTPVQNSEPVISEVPPYQPEERFSIPQTAQNVLLVFVALLLGLLVGVFFFNSGKPDKEFAERVSGAGEEKSVEIPLTTSGDALEYSANGSYMAFLEVSGFEGERSGGKLRLVDTETGDVTEIDGIHGFAFIDRKTALVSKMFRLDPDSGPVLYEEGYQPDPDRVKVAEEATSLTLNEMDIFAYGGKPVAAAFFLFKLDLQTKKLTSLKMNGGGGGLFSNEAGDIFISNNYTQFSYKFPKESANAGFLGSYPIFKFNPSSATNAPVLDDSAVFSDLSYPRIARPSSARVEILKRGSVMFITKNNQFFIVAKPEEKIGNYAVIFSDLTKEEAFSILSPQLPFADCEKSGVSGSYKSCIVGVEDAGSEKMVVVVYDGLYDDSISAVKIESRLIYADNRWWTGDMEKTFRCAKGRGHQDFSEELCL